MSDEFDNLPTESAVTEGLHKENPPRGDNDPKHKSYKEVSNDRDDYVTNLDFFIGGGEKKRIVGIVVQWSIRKDARIGLTKDPPTTRLKFKMGDKITKWVIFATSGYVYGFHIRSNQNPEGVNIGVKEGDMYNQDLGNNLLAGLHGKQNDNGLQSLGVIFYEKDK